MPVKKLLLLLLKCSVKCVIIMFVGRAPKGMLIFAWSAGIKVLAVLNGDRSTWVGTGYFCERADCTNCKV